MLLRYEYMSYINEHIFCYITHIKWLKKEKKSIYINTISLTMCPHSKKYTFGKKNWIQIKNINVYQCRLSKKQRKWESLDNQMVGEILKAIKRLITKKKLM